MYYICLSKKEKEIILRRGLFQKITLIFSAGLVREHLGTVQFLHL